MLRYIYMLMLWLGFTSCIVPADIDELKLKNSHLSVLVVEGEITNEQKAHTVRLTRSFDYQENPKIVQVSGAKIEIREGENVFPLTEIEAGIYQTNADVKGEIGKTYTLKIELDEKIYEASDKMQAVKPLEDVMELLTKDQDGDYTLKEFTGNDFIKNEIAKIRLRLYRPYLPDTDTLRDVSVVYYHHPYMESSAMFQFEGAIWEPKIKAGTLITRRKWSISDNYYHFIRAMLLETDWRGGYFDAMPANVPSNFSQGALGFFNASAIMEETKEIN
jgi:hypothetical protein